MKVKNVLTLFLGVTLLFFVVAGCSDDEDSSDSCSSLATSAAVAYTAYKLNKTTANCENLATAINNYLDNCSGIDNDTFDYYSNLLGTLSCINVE